MASIFWWPNAVRELTQVLLAMCILGVIGTRPLSAQPSEGSEPRQPAAEPANPIADAQAGQESEAAASVVFLNLDRSGLGALVQAKVRDKQVCKWWPPGASYQLLREIELSAAVDIPPAGEGHETPKDAPPLPDAMILLRTQTGGKTPVADLVVCDPNLGLRLGSARVTLTKDIARDVECLTEAATIALRKRGETMTRLWGVPPFRCNDLGAADGDLRHLLTQEVEQTLLKRKGVFVVELDYAYAIAAARRLAGIEKSISRISPRFVLGEYRHEASDAGRQLAISLTLHQAGRPAQPVSLEPQPTDVAIEKLRERVGEVTGGIGGFSTELEHPIGEIKLLDVVQREYEKAGDVETQIALAETSLLLIGVEPRVRLEIAHLLGKLGWQEWRRAEELPVPSPPRTNGVAVLIEGSMPAGQVEREYERALVRAMNHYRRGLRHVSIVADGLKAPPPPELVPPNAPRLPVVQYGHATPAPRPTSPEPLKVIAHQLRLERASLVVRMARIHAHNGDSGDVYLLRELPPEDRHALALRLILELKDYPRAEGRLQQYVLSGMAMMTGWSPEEDERFLSQVESIDHPGIAAAVRNAREQLASQAQARTPRVYAPNAAPPARPAAPVEWAAPPKESDAQIVFRPISLPWKYAGGGAVCELCLPAGRDVDLFCASGQILMMKKKGEAKLLWDGGIGLNFRNFLSFTPLACYDGKFAWIPASFPQKLPRLVVVDPETGKVTEVTAEHGLPEGPVPPGRQPMLATAPLSPGKALVVGSFGQTWLAIATFDPDKGPSVKVIHECVEQAIRDDQEQWKSSKLAFEPHYMATLQGKMEESGRVEQRVIIGRAAGGGAHNHPLLFNPDTNEVQVLAADYQGLHGGQPFVQDGVLYACSASAKGRSIWRVGFPDFEPKLVKEHPFKSTGSNLAIGMEPDRVHLVLDQWYTAPSWDEPLTPLRGEAPWKARDRISLLRSNHYGWILQTLTSNAYAVEFLEGAERGASESKE